MFSWFMKKQQPQLEFLCFDDDLGNIPEPYPARKLIPEWYKALPMKLGLGFEQSTLKRCPPFLDAMVTGWIIPLVADVRIQSNHDCSHIEYESQYPRPMIENHQSHSHLNFRDRINLFEEVRTAYYIKDIMLMNEWEKKLSNS